MFLCLWLDFFWIKRSSKDIRSEYKKGIHIFFLDNFDSCFEGSLGPKNLIMCSRGSSSNADFWALREIKTALVETPHKTMLQEDFLVLLNLKRAKKTRVRERSLLEVDRVIGGPCYRRIPSIKNLKKNQTSALLLIEIG